MDLKQLRQNVLNKPQEQPPEKTLIRIQHILMLKYGWIPFEEFKNLPMETINGLLGQIEYDWEQEKKENDKMKHRGRK